MRVLLFSTVVYLAGIATVLYLRPALMFDREGRWKEFGIRGDDTSVFPFWFFCIGWAAVSYLVAGLLTSEEAAAALAPANWATAASKAASLTTAASGLYKGFRGAPARDDEEEGAASPLPSNAVMPLPVSGPKRGGGGGGSRKGSKSSKASRGPPPKGYYLYVGGDPPAAASTGDSSDSEEEGASWD